MLQWYTELQRGVALSLMAAGVAITVHCPCDPLWECHLGQMGLVLLGLDVLYTWSLVSVFSRSPELPASEEENEEESEEESEELSSDEVNSDELPEAEETQDLDAFVDQHYPLMD